MTPRCSTETKQICRGASAGEPNKIRSWETVYKSNNGLVKTSPPVGRWLQQATKADSQAILASFSPQTPTELGLLQLKGSNWIFRRPHYPIAMYFLCLFAFQMNISGRSWLFCSMFKNFIFKKCTFPPDHIHTPRIELLVYICSTCS